MGDLSPKIGIVGSIIWYLDWLVFGLGLVSLLNIFEHLQRVWASATGSDFGHEASSHENPIHVLCNQKYINI
jgi:hypothetical protein